MLIFQHSLFLFTFLWVHIFFLFLVNGEHLKFLILIMNGKGKYFFIILGLVFMSLMVWYFSSIIAYVLISVVLSFIGRPLVELFNKIRIGRWKFPVALSAGITLLLIWTVMILFIKTFVPLVAAEANQLSRIDVKAAAESLSEPISRMEVFISQFVSQGEDFKLQSIITEKFVSLLQISTVSDAVSMVIGTLGNIFIALFSISFITFFFLKDSNLFLDGIVLLVPERHEEGVRHVLSSIKYLLMRYFVGLFFEVILVGILDTLGLSLVGIGFNHAVVIGAFAGMMNVIPYIGPIIGAIFGLIVGVASHLGLDFYSEILPLLGYMAIVFALVLVIDNILFQPLIYSSSVNAHPLEIFLVILIAGSMAGILGMMLAIPSYTILRVVAKEFFNNYRWVKKLTEKI